MLPPLGGWFGEVLWKRNFLLCTTLSLSLTLSVALTNAQSRNLLQNTTADMETRYWRAMGEATVETTTTNNVCFVVRNGGYFYQDVIFPNDAVPVRRTNRARFKPAHQS
jgi:hypothetical protein